ncbi:MULTISPECIES: hypothetical protein [unclassified Rhodococcus (in: high G+C Gram-positive bacteria)]|uniref:hypothetical protein n=1 Tax=unclassified Rhodococcus (in: high G+C Gram-positive bacteria) TaxID=192944 RepID=UPI0012F6B5FD|nr:MULTISPECIES: hypothetical protein [unclassified Rhodococcus (in: high G+C Gram-positive bacteria)]
MAACRVVLDACVRLPQLADEQIDSLPPEVRQTYRQLRAVDPAELVRFLGHTDLVNAAWAFLMPVCVDGDLLSAWPNVDPDFRAVLAQKWVRDNHCQMTVDC